VLVLDQPDKGANILSRGMLDEFERHLDSLASDVGLAGLIVASGKPGTFIAGADLREFVASFGTPSETVESLSRRGRTLFARLAQVPFVTVAAIDGICVGGGAELAVWCDRRIVTANDKTQFGFPEVKIGLIPGWGGTARAPRICGLGNAVEMICGGEPLSAAETVRRGLAIGPVAPDRLLAAAIDEVRESVRTGSFLRDRESWSRPIAYSEQELAFLGATAAAEIQGQTRGQYPAPSVALEQLIESAALDVEQACIKESEGISRVFGTPVNRALVNVFFLTDRNKKDRGVERSDVPASPIERVGVLGAGLMGSGIAGANLRSGLSVAMSDANGTALEKGIRAALEDASFDRRVKGVHAAKLLEIAPRLRWTDGPASMGPCDLVVEAVVENIHVKRQVLERIESALPDGAFLASNTSTIPISRLAESLRDPERFCGIHFFNPVRRMKLVEVIRGARTSDTTVATAVAYAKRLGKMPIVVGDGPGFLVNRLLFPYMSESLELLAEGVPIQTIERAATSFGMPMGPIELYDMVGLDTAIYAGLTMFDAFPTRIRPSPILPALVKAGRLGQKNGKGFFAYGDGSSKKAARPRPDAQSQSIVDRYAKAGPPLDATAVQRRLFLPMLLEATRVLAEGLVRDVRDVDLGLIFGIGFPAFRGGLLFWADQVGLPTVLEWLKPLAEHGERLLPTPKLIEMAEQNRPFYPKASE